MTIETLLAEHSRLSGKIADASVDAATARRSGYPVAAAHCQRCIRALEIELAGITAAIDTIRSREAQEFAEEKRRIRHGELIALCRAAKEKAETSVLELDRARAEQIQAENKAEAAKGAVGRHRDNLLSPSDYPTSAELEQERELGTALEAELEKALAGLRAAKEHTVAMQHVALRAQREFEALAVQEANLRPAESQIPGRVTLSRNADGVFSIS